MRKCKAGSAYLLGLPPIQPQSAEGKSLFTNSCFCCDSGVARSVKVLLGCPVLRVDEGPDQGMASTEITEK
jgi:hypothetical protein